VPNLVSKYVRLFLNGATKIVHTAQWPDCQSKHVFSNCWNLLYDKSASFSCDGRLFDSPGPAVANALSPRHSACLARCGTYSLLLIIGEKTAGVCLRSLEQARVKILTIEQTVFKYNLFCQGPEVYRPWNVSKIILHFY